MKNLNNKKLRVGLLAAFVAAALTRTGNAQEKQVEYARDFASPYCLEAHTYMTPGICGPCDRARDSVRRLAAEYPIEFVYRDTPSGAKKAAKRGVTRFPTYLLVKRSVWGDDVEIERLQGADDAERRIVEAFERVGVRAKPKPPKRAPRPLPPPPRPKPRPKPTPRPWPWPWK